MALYEHVNLVRPDLSAQQAEALNDQWKALIEQNGGTVSKIEYWGVKSLSYRIRKNRKAHYSLMNIDASPAAVAEMERQMRLNEDVMRILTIRVDAHEEGPSAMLQRRERDERRERERGERFGERGERFGDRGDRYGDRAERPGRRDREERREGTPEAAETAGEV